MRAKGYSKEHTKMWLDCVKEDSYYELKVPAGTYTDNNIFIVGDASIRVFQELENNGLIVDNVIKPWDLYDEIGLKSLVKLALENFNNNILNCDPVYITEPITNKKKSKKLYKVRC